MDKISEKVFELINDNLEELIKENDYDGYLDELISHLKNGLLHKLIDIDNISYKLADEVEQIKDTM